MTRTETERLAVVETELAGMKAMLTEVRDSQRDMVALRNKGIGAFWVASTLLGTSIVGTLTFAWEWIGKHT